MAVAIHIGNCDRERLVPVQTVAFLCPEDCQSGFGGPAGEWSAIDYAGNKLDLAEGVREGLDCSCQSGNRNLRCSFGLSQDGEVGTGVFPEGEERLKSA
jgi:hypothetical protein